MSYYRNRDDENQYVRGNIKDGVGYKMVGKSVALIY
jgi:hypothetical protein